MFNHPEMGTQKKSCASAKNVDVCKTWGELRLTPTSHYNQYHEYIPLCNPIKDCVFTAKVGDLINMVWPSWNVHPESSQFQWSLGLKQRYTKHYKTIWFPPSNMEEFSRVSLQPIQGPQTADQQAVIWFQQAVIWFHSENHRDTEPFQHIKHHRLYGNPNLWIDPILSQRPPRIQHHSVSFSFPKSFNRHQTHPYRYILKQIAFKFTSWTCIPVGNNMQ